MVTNSNSSLPSSSAVSDFTARLVGGTAVSNGRVEINYKGEWGTVCDDSWDGLDAQVVCRQLGYTGGVARLNAAYGPGSGPIYMDELECGGSEASLSSCRHNGWGNHNCGHHKDAGVECEGKELNAQGMPSPPPPSPPPPSPLPEGVQFLVMDVPGFKEYRADDKPLIAPTGSTMFDVFADPSLEAESAGRGFDAHESLFQGISEIPRQMIVLSTCSTSGTEGGNIEESSDDAHFYCATSEFSNNYKSTKVKELSSETRSTWANDENSTLLMLQRSTFISNCKNTLTEICSLADENSGPFACTKTSIAKVAITDALGVANANTQTAMGVVFALLALVAAKLNTRSKSKQKSDVPTKWHTEDVEDELADEEVQRQETAPLQQLGKAPSRLTKLFKPDHKPDSKSKQLKVATGNMLVGATKVTLKPAEAHVKTAAAKVEPAAIKVSTAETQEVTVTLRKPSANASTGLTIIAGETKDAPPLIKDVEGLALESGVRVGDSIVAINDKPAVDRITAAALIRAEPQTIVLRLKRPNSLAAPGSITTVAATFKMTGPLGITFTQPNPDPNSRSIEEIAEGGLAHTEGSLQVGDLIVSVNDQPVANFARISDMLKGASEARIVAHRSGSLVAAAALAATATTAEEETQAETPSPGPLSDEEAQRQKLASRDWLLGQNTAAPAPADQLPEELEAEVHRDDAVGAHAVEEQEAASAAEAAGVGVGPVSPANNNSLQRARLAAAARQAERTESQDVAAASTRDGMAEWLAEAERGAEEEVLKEDSEVFRT